MKKSNVITDMQAEIAALKEAGKPKKKEDVVCDECGGDLDYVEEGVVYCPVCKVYYEYTEDEEEE